MKLINERMKIKEAITSFQVAWGSGSYGTDMRGVSVGAELAKLNPETVSKGEVDALIGNKSWTRVENCSECGAEAVAVVELGEEPDYDSMTAFVCESCLRKALDLITKGDEA